MIIGPGKTKMAVSNGSMRSRRAGSQRGPPSRPAPTRPPPNFAPPDIPGSGPTHGGKFAGVDVHTGTSVTCLPIIL
jgi:hypothetical protein